MKNFFLFTFVLILTACSAQPPQVTVTLEVTVTLPPTNTPVPTATFTPIPTATASQFSLDTWAGTDTDRAAFLENGGQVNDKDGVGWNTKTGLVHYEKNAQGEWIHYPNGMVPIPPGPGYESLPPLEVPYYASFTEAMTAITKELPWGEIPNVYRAQQEANWGKLVDEYWGPITHNGTWHAAFYGNVNIHQSSQPKETATVWFSPMQLPGGNIEMRLIYESARTGFESKAVLIHGDAQQIKSEIQRIDQCVKDNPGSDKLPELCASDIIKVASANE